MGDPHPDGTQLHGELLQHSFALDGFQNGVAQQAMQFLPPQGKGARRFRHGDDDLIDQIEQMPGLWFDRFLVNRRDLLDGKQHRSNVPLSDSADAGEVGLVEMAAQLQFLIFLDLVDVRRVQAIVADGEGVVVGTDILKQNA